MGKSYKVTANAAGEIQELYRDEPGYAAPPSGAKAISAADGDMLARVGDFGSFVLDASGAVSRASVSLASAQRAALSRVDSLAARKRTTAVQGVSPCEMSSWPIKRAEAVAYAASKNAADAPNLAAEAAARGITLDALVAKVLAKAAALLALEAQIAGAAGKHGDAIMALQSTADVEAYDFSGGWPQ